MKKTTLSLMITLGLLVFITYPSIIPTQMYISDHGADYEGR